MGNKTYTTTQGDTWDTIAYKLFGDEMYIMEILQANQSLADVVILPADTKIVIPQIDKNITEINLVPWK